MDKSPFVAQSFETGTEAGKKSVMERIWQYKMHYLIVLPALFLIFGLKIIPFLQGIFMSFTDYNIFHGWFQSEWVGLDNYKALFENEGFQDALVNTITYKLSYLVLSGVLALVVALALSGIRSGVVRSIVTTGLLIPYVIPTVLFGYLALSLFGPETTIGVAANSGRLLMLMTEVVKTCGIPIVVALAAIAAKHADDKSGNLINEESFWKMNVLPAIRAISALTLVQLSIVASTDRELAYLFLNPINAMHIETIDTFIFRIGFSNMRYSLASAASTIQFLIQFVLVVAAYFIVRGSFIKSLFSRTFSETGNINRGSKGIGYLVGFISTGLVLWLLYYSFIAPFFASSDNSMPLSEVLPFSKLIGFIILFIFAAVFHLVITVTLAYPLTVKLLPGRTIYRLFLLFVMTMSSVAIVDFLLVISLEMIGTYFPYPLMGLINIVSVFALKSIFNSKYGHLKEQAERENRSETATFFTLFIPGIWKPLLALGALQFILLWNAFLPSVIYSPNPETMTPAGILYQLSRMSSSPEAFISDSFVMQVGAIVSLPALILFLALRKWMTSEVLTAGLFKR
ncbi:hypothetical protein ACFQZE_04175 [Paenibacillus sp. GCM10027627]|uniref:hypothetical protein n=1 Tax=unclassified Paenibacillus TaxID=185978 RepID=UPI00362EB158